LQAKTYIPGVNNLVIPADIYTTGEQTIKGDTNLIAKNIKGGVTIFGVKGSFFG
jgi:hypothetical protein